MVATCPTANKPAFGFQFQQKTFNARSQRCKAAKLQLYRNLCKICQTSVRSAEHRLGSLENATVAGRAGARRSSFAKVFDRAKSTRRRPLTAFIIADLKIL
jgi:hypothetical protein